MNFRIGNGYDAHKLAEGRKLILGGVHIPNDKGCVAHSDGDALIHALCDALLGALALGDIGHHFPDSDDSFKDIDSRILLRKVMDLLSERHFSVVNVDCTVLLQKPKLAPFVDQMRRTLAQDLKVDIEAVSVKASTTEKMGFVGREEGVAVYATVLLSKEP